MFAAVAATLILQSNAAHSLNHLTHAEKAAGWTLLFDGKSTKGWHSFKQKMVEPGWEVKDGVLASSGPNGASDIVSDAMFGWFELTLDFNLSKGQNSGIMFHVRDEDDATWHTGPEIQIYDDHGEPGAQKTGFLYDLYSSSVDSTKPAGQWNHFRIVIAPKKCATYVNGVLYYEFVLNSPDFKARVAKSKFGPMPHFAKYDTGSIAIQGDHGVVSFKNIKIRPLK